jgi:hypothetical protein
LETQQGFKKTTWQESISVVKKGETLLENLYTEDDVAQTIAQMQAVNFREEIQICEEVSAFLPIRGIFLVRRPFL